MKSLAENVNEIMPTTAVRLVVMLYDGAISYLQAAIESVENGNEEERDKAVSMTISIISQLCLALDRDHGGEIADNLGRIYGYMLSRLPEIKRNNDAQPARDVIGMLYTLYQSWRELDMQFAVKAAGDALWMEDEGKEHPAI